MNYRGLFRSAALLAAFVPSAIAHAQQPNVYEQLLKTLPKVEMLDFDYGMKCFRVYVKERPGSISDTTTYCGDGAGKYLAFVDVVVYKPPVGALMIRECLDGQRCPAPPRNFITGTVRRGTNAERNLYSEFLKARDNFDKQEKLKAAIRGQKKM